MIPAAWYFLTIFPNVSESGHSPRTTATPGISPVTSGTPRDLIIGSTTCPTHGSAYGASSFTYFIASIISAQTAVAKPAFKAVSNNGFSTINDLATPKAVSKSAKVVAFNPVAAYIHGIAYAVSGNATGCSLPFSATTAVKAWLAASYAWLAPV